jgi:hypothetical protein
MEKYTGDKAFALKAEFLYEPFDIPEWASSDETIIRLAATSPDGMTAMFHVGRAGRAIITVTAHHTNAMGRLGMVGVTDIKVLQSIGMVRAIIRPSE